MKKIKSYKLFENADNESIKDSIISNLSHVFDILNDKDENIRVFTKEEFLDTDRVATTGNLIHFGQWCEFAIKYRIPTDHLRSGKVYNPLRFDEHIKIKEYQLEILKDIQESINISSDLLDIEGEARFFSHERWNYIFIK